MSAFTLLTLLAAIGVNGYTQPVGAEPKGNPIYTPGLHEVVPACKAYTVTWKPTTQGTIDLVLLKGPSTNAVPQYAIASAIPNTGSFIWTPASDLVPTGDEGYGLEIIDTQTGQYQYSTQFGISTSDCKSGPGGYGSSSSSSSSTSSSSSSSAGPSGYHSSSSSASASHNATSSVGPTGYGSSTSRATGTVSHNATVIQPTHSMTRLTTLPTVPSYGSSTTVAASASAYSSSSAAPSAPASTGAASDLAMNVVGMLAVVGVAFLGM